MVKSQSASASPGISTVPRSVVQVPMTDNMSTGTGGVSTSENVLPTGTHVSIDEEEKEEDEESGHTDDEEDVDDINHTTLPKETVHTNSPGKRVQRVDFCKHVRRICNHDMTDHVMMEDSTHVCVYRVSDHSGEGGEKSYCNPLKPLKLFRSTSDSLRIHQYKSRCCRCRRT